MAKNTVPEIPQDELAYQLFRETNDAVVIVDPNTLGVVEVNPAMQRISGYRRPELIGRQISELLTSAQVVFAGLLETLSETGLYHSREGFDLKCKDGKIKSVNISANKLHTESGALGLVVLRDVTKRRQAESRLLEAQKLMADAQQIARVGSWSFDVETQEFNASDTLLLIFGFPQGVRVSLEEVFGRFTEDDLLRAQECWHKVLTAGTRANSEYKIELPTGEVRYVHCITDVYSRNQEHQPCRLIGVIQDITERKQAEQLEADHRDNLAKLQSVLDQVHGFVWEFDSKTQQFTYVSDGAESVFGYPIEEWYQPGFFRGILHPDESSDVLEFCAIETAKGNDHVMEYQLLDAEGIYHRVRDVVRVRKDVDGTPLGIYGLILDISERTRILERLEQSEQRFEKLFNDSPTALWESDWSAIRHWLDEHDITDAVQLERYLDANPNQLFDLSGLIKLLAVNRGTLEMYDAESTEDLSPLKSVFGPDSLHSFRRQLVAFASGKTTFACENVNYTLTGRRIHVALNVTVAPGCEHNLKRVYGSVVDITGRKHAELLRVGQQRVLELLATDASLEETLTTLVDEIENQSPFLRSAVFCVEDQSFALIAPGQIAEELTTLINGMTVSEVEQTASLNDSVSFDLRVAEADEGNSDDYAPAAPEAIHRAAKACGYSVSSLSKLRRADDRAILGVLAVFRTGPPCFDEHEKDIINSFRRVASLVLEDEAAQRALRRRTNELNSVFSAYPDALLRISTDGTIKKRYSGDKGEVFGQNGFQVGRKLWSCVRPEEAYQFREAIKQVTEGHSTESVNFSTRQGDDELHFEARFLPLAESEEQITILRDVTKLRSTQEQLRNVNEQFADMFNESPDAIFVESINGQVLDANRAACNLHQMTREQLIGSLAIDLVPPDERDLATSRIVPIATGEVDNFESQSLRSDGVAIPVSVRISSIQYHGQPALLLHVRDISSRREEERRQREQERQLAHVSRLTMMGQLVAGIAHEIRQPLWSISTLADVVHEAIGRADLQEQLEKIRQYTCNLVSEARRVNQITTRMFAFARKGQPERATAKLNDIIQDAIAMTHHRAKSNRISTTCDVTPEDLSTLCDKILIEQVVVNLLNNAYSAITRSDSGKRAVNIEASQLDDTFVRVTVADSGPGLPDDVTPEQLFEGFFTTTHTGMGIGLALSRSFVEDHGGKIWAESNATGGMTFSFTLRIDGGVE